MVLGIGSVFGRWCHCLGCLDRPSCSITLYISTSCSQEHSNQDRDFTETRVCRDRDKTRTIFL